MKLSQEEMKKYYTNNKPMIWQYKTLYQIKYSQNTGFGLLKVYKKPKTDYLGITVKGRYQAMTVKNANSYIK